MSVNGSGLDQNPSLISQAQSILENATSLQQQLDYASLPQPSFSPDGRRNWSDAQHLPELLDTRLRLLDAAQSMLDLVMGPLDTLIYLAGPLNTKIDIFRTLDQLKVAEHVPLVGDIRILDLAKIIGVDSNILERHLRCAYLMGIFREPRRGYVAHTGTSAEMPNYSPYSQMASSELFRGGSHFVAQTMRSDLEEVNGKRPVPIELADHTGKGRGFWTQLTEDDQDNRGMEKFSAGMNVLGSSLSGGSYASFVQGIDWNKVGEGTVIDVGGGNGHVPVNIARQLPNVQFIVQDLESNAATAKQNIKDRGLQSRVKFQTHNFFQPQPTDLEPRAYFIARVFHDWGDDDCIRVIKNFLPAMEKYGTKLLIVERILPNNVDEISRYKEWILRWTDILMYTLFTAKERSLVDFENLVKKADSRLKVVDCKQPTNSIVGFLQVEMVS